MTPPSPTAWHSLPLGTVLDRLQSTPSGLTQAAAQLRLQQTGPNHLPQQPPPGWGEILLRQFRSPLIYILGIAAAVSAAVGDLKDAGFIVAVLILNAVIGGYQEWRAEQSSQALQQLLKIWAAVMRDGEVCDSCCSPRRRP
ncbi:MAG: cation-transporting P-type ATPase, partial [Cyanobacteria bacterium P01_D01_bin.14]